MTTMTLTRAPSLLILYRSKVEEAVGLVPRMCAEEKLKAVQFWNIVSEKLQDIVNSSAADINAIALKMDEDTSNKLGLEVSSSPGSEALSQSNLSSPDYLNLSSNYSVCSDPDTQLHASDIDNVHLKEILSSGSTSAQNEGQHIRNEVSTIPHIHHLSPAVISRENLSKGSNQDVSDSFLNVQNLRADGCDTFIANTYCTSETSGNLVSVGETESDKCDLDKEVQCIHQRCSDYQPILQSKKNSVISNCKSCDRNSVSYNENGAKNSKYAKKNYSKPPHFRQLAARKENMMVNSKRKLDNEKILGIISVLRENSKDSCNSDNCDLNSIVNLDESNQSLPAENMVSFVVSNTEEILAKTEMWMIKTNEEKQVTENKSSFVCKVCDKQFPDNSSLASHSSVHDKPRLRRSSDDKDNVCSVSAQDRPYLCTLCQAKFASKGNLIVHMRKHTGEKPYCCNKCTASFSTKGNLKRHLRTHSGEKPWQCSRCSKCFTEKKSLDVHMRRHTGERPYECELCGKRFTQSGILQTHRAMHLNEKSHLCEHCGKSFRQKSQLRIHKLRHDNIRKYSCPSCSSRFLTKGDLERHGRTHTGERPFSCELCPKSFTRQQSLNEHMNRHYGRKPYECKYCGKSFAEMSACYKHTKHHEKDVDPKYVNGDQIENLDEPPTFKTSRQLLSTENKCQSGEGTSSYVLLHHTVLKNVEDIENSKIQTISLFSPCNEENSISENAVGVLNAINMLTNTSVHQENF